MPQLLGPPMRFVDNVACNISSNFSKPDFCARPLKNSWAQGSLVLSVRGSSFGSYYDQSVGASVTQTKCQQSEWTSMTSWYCKIPAGSLLSRGISITVQEIHNSVSSVLSYNSVDLNRLLKPQNYFMQTRLSQTASAHSLWIGTSNIIIPQVCKVWPGAASTNRAQATACVRIGSLLEACHLRRRQY